MARLVQVGERLHNDAIGLLESLHASWFCSAAPAPHAKPCHDTLFPTFLDLDFLISDLQPNPLCLSAPPERRDRTTEQPTMQAFFANDRNAQRRRGGATCDEPHTVDSTL